MAVLALGMVGAAVGSSIGGTILGISATTIGLAVGSAVGGVIDREVFGLGVNQSGPRLGDLTVQVSTYGRMLPVAYAGRIAGNVIWASDKREERESAEQGGKGGSSSVSTDAYHYYVSLAVSLGEGPIAAVKRCWADSTLIWDVDVQGDSPTGVTIYLGTDTQTPDPVIESYEGAGNVPAYRNQAYAVFENFHLNDYGGRIPNFTFEVVGRLPAGWGEDLAQGVAVGLDGDIWVVASLQRTVTRIDAVELTRKAVIGRDSADYLGSLKAQPWRICCEPTTGHLFVTCMGDGCVQRIDPASNGIVATIATEPYPQEIIGDGLGNVWVSHPLRDKLSRIAVADNSVATVGLSGQPFAFCRDGDGGLWVSCTDQVVHFDPATSAIRKRIDLDGKWFPGGLAWNAGDGRIWFACSGNDVVGVINPNNYEVSWRNSGTWPAYAASHPDDPRHTVFVSMLYGNRLKLLRRGEDDGLEEFMEYKTEVWPGPLAATADGRCLVSNTNRPFFQEVQGPKA